MKVKDAIVPASATDESRFLALIRKGLKELTEIRRLNKATDAEIRRLQASTRKKLDRIEENLEYVEAAR
jgi:hypothetical protein